MSQNSLKVLHLSMSFLHGFREKLIYIFKNRIRMLRGASNVYFVTEKIIRQGFSLISDAILSPHTVHETCV
jgi:hypothetical protein